VRTECIRIQIPTVASSGAESRLAAGDPARPSFRNAPQCGEEGISDVAVITRVQVGTCGKSVLVSDARLERQSSTGSAVVTCIGVALDA